MIALLGHPIHVLLFGGLGVLVAKVFFLGLAIVLIAGPITGVLEGRRS